MAMLSITRWAIPPLSWKGYASSIRLASAIPIFVSRSAAAARASRLLTAVCSKSHLFDLASDGDDGVEGRARVLED